MASSNVYGTAVRPGWRTRIAGPLAQRARAKRRRMYVDLMAPAESDPVLDVGCGSVGLATLGVPGRVTGVDHGDRPDYPGERFVQADARALPVRRRRVRHRLLQLADRAPARRRPGPGRGRDGPRGPAPVRADAQPLVPDRAARAAAVRALAAAPLGRRLWKLGVTGEPFDDIQLLAARELRRLFPDARIVRERVGPLTKSLIAVRD